MDGEWSWISPGGPNFKLSLSDISTVNGNIRSVVDNGGNRCMGSLKKIWTNEVPCGKTNAFHVICQFANQGHSEFGNIYFK